MKRVNAFKFVFVLFLLVCSQYWLLTRVFAEDSTPVADTAFDIAAKALEKSKEEVQRLKDSWDKTRLETTLYDQRAKRAFQRWAAHGARAKTKAREQAKATKEKAELELQLAIEKRKLAYNQWQAALLRQMAKESEVKALDQDKDTTPVREKIKQLEQKISRQSAGDGRPPAKNNQ